MNARKMGLGKILVILGVTALVPLLAHGQENSDVTLIKNATVITITHEIGRAHV